MSYTKTAPLPVTEADLPTDESDLRRLVAKLRTEVRHKNAVLQSAYERQANEKLKVTVEKERQHMQAQMDEAMAQAQAIIDQYRQQASDKHDEALHWHKQCEIMLALMEDTEAKAAAEIERARAEATLLVAELETRVRQLERDLDRLRATRRRQSKGKRIIEA